MKKIFVENDILKNAICKKSVDNGIITKRIFGVTFQYVHGRIYQPYISILKYIKSYLDFSVDEMISDFETKSKIKNISSEVYNADLKKYLKIVNDFNPSILKPCAGSLRKVQLSELEFAKEIITDIEKNTDIKPFMDDGTLLGAVRHKGFIPWDDDMDFSLMRSDFDKLEKYFENKYLCVDISQWPLKGLAFKNKLNETLDKYSNQIFFFRRNTSMKIFRGTSKSYCFCDFFPLDYYDDYLNIGQLRNYALEIRDKLFDETKTFFEVMEFQKNELKTNNLTVSDSNNIQVGLDNYDFIFYTMKGMRRKTDIFPLKNLVFEDTEFWAPNNPHEYLKTLFNNYNRIPYNVKIAGHMQNFNIIN